MGNREEKGLFRGDRECKNVELRFLTALVREGLCFSYGADNQGVWHEMWFLRARRRACKHSVFNFLLGLLLGIATCGISSAFRARKQLWG